MPWTHSLTFMKISPRSPPIQLPLPHTLRHRIPHHSLEDLHAVPTAVVVQIADLTRWGIRSTEASRGDHRRSHRGIRLDRLLARCMLLLLHPSSPQEAAQATGLAASPCTLERHDYQHAASLGPIPYATGHVTGGIWLWWSWIWTRGWVYG